MEEGALDLSLKAGPSNVYQALWRIFLQRRKMM
ncbi:hypothetical protein VULLAG_LOCUS5882 [Vulpes lagopus]